MGSTALLAAILAATAAARPAAAEGTNVILVTVDGVRPHEVFRGADPLLDAAAASRPDHGAAFPLLWARLLRGEGAFLTGEPRTDPFVTRNLSVISLPAYQGIATGRDDGCWTNGCDRVRVETVLERARRELGLARTEVAAFASWPAVARAMARDPGAITANAGFEPVALEGDPAHDAGTALLNRLQLEDRPPWRGRADRHTWAHAMRHLERHRPRLLWIALGDPDEWGHLGDYDRYFASLRALDARLEELRERLARMGEYGRRTSVLVTTDHGRGEGHAWEKHGVLYGGSHRAWLYAWTPFTCRPVARAVHGPYDHLNVRPTVEALLGLAPCRGCQRPIRELVPPAGAAYGCGAEGTIASSTGSRPAAQSE